MVATLHPAAPHALPPFITAPGETDTMLVGMGIFLVAAVLTVGLLFLRLHTLPERIAHKSEKLQFEIVAVLGLIALFTHMHIFWVIGLLLAMIDLPDFGSSLGRIARGVETMAGISPDKRDVEEYDGNPTVEAEARLLRVEPPAIAAPGEAAKSVAGHGA